MTSQQFTFKLDTNEKNAFLEACKAKDSNASRELRLFIRSYIAKNGQREFRL
jgi:hypothetical protein